MAKPLALAKIAPFFVAAKIGLMSIYQLLGFEK
jgi:hypothetical protein